MGHQHFQSSAFRTILACFILFSLIIFMAELIGKEAIVVEEENIVLQDVKSSFSTEKLIEIEIYDSEYY